MQKGQNQQCFCNISNFCLKLNQLIKHLTPLKHFDRKWWIKKSRKPRRIWKFPYKHVALLRVALWGRPLSKSWYLIVFTWRHDKKPISWTLQQSLTAIKGYGCETQTEHLQVNIHDQDRWTPHFPQVCHALCVHPSYLSLNSSTNIWLKQRECFVIQNTCVYYCLETRLNI